MILPTKHIPQDQALIGIGAILLKNMRYPQTVSSLWNKVKDNPNISNFERFVLGLDMLKVLNLVELSDGFLRKVEQ